MYLPVYKKDSNTSNSIPYISADGQSLQLAKTYVYSKVYTVKNLDANNLNIITFIKAKLNKTD